MKTKIKKCPFCKGKAEVLKITFANGETPSYRVFCPFCGAEQPLRHSADEAIERWNRRGINNTK